MNHLFRAVLDCKSRNELTTTFILGDQRPSHKNIKYWTSFLNQDTPALTGFEKIAKKMDQAVVFINIQWKKRGHYDVVFQKLTDNAREINDFDLTEDYFRKLEKIIIDRPELWLWTHRRWKHKRQIPSQ